MGAGEATGGATATTTGWVLTGLGGLTGGGGGTTKGLALALATSTPAAGVLARVASSHLRVGTVEVVAHSLRPDLRDDTMRRLLAFTLERHLPQQVGTDDPAMAVLEHVVEVQSALVAQWMSVGFIHGVMNTDNVALSGETLTRTCRGPGLGTAIRRKASSWARSVITESLIVAERPAWRITRARISAAAAHR